MDDFLVPGDEEHISVMGNIKEDDKGERKVEFSAEKELKVTPMKEKEEEENAATQERRGAAEEIWEQIRDLTSSMEQMEQVESYAEFESETSSFLKGVQELMEKLSASAENVSWGEEEDPNLEQSLLEDVNGVLFNNSFQLENALNGWKLDTFDRVGGPNTLRSLWLRLKSLDQVLGVKRKISEMINDSSSSSSQSEGGENSGLGELLTQKVTEENVSSWCEKVFNIFEKLNIECPSREEWLGEEEWFGEEARGRNEDRGGEVERVREELMFIGELDIFFLRHINIFVINIFVFT